MIPDELDVMDGFEAVFIHNFEFGGEWGRLSSLGWLAMLETPESRWLRACWPYSVCSTRRRRR